MAAARMRRVDEAVREVLATPCPGPQGPSHRIRDRHRRQDQPRPAPCAGVRQRARDRRGARGDARGPAVGARHPAGARGPRAAPEAHADARSSSTTTPPSAPPGWRSCSSDEESPDGVTSDNGHASLARRRCSTRSAAARPLPPGHAREPRRRRARLARRRCTTSCSALGKDSRHVHGPRRVPAALRVPLLRPRGPAPSVPPDDLEQRTIIFLDCGNIDRNPAEVVKGDDVHILNIDHHHDNTRFGTVNHVVPEASCTAEIVWDLMRALGVQPTQTIAEALYVGLVTDTGKFMYENTGRRAHVMAAELIEAGVDVHAIYRRLYEGMPYAKLELLARGAGEHPALRRRPPDVHAPVARRLPPRRRRGVLLRGHHRPPARGRGHEGRRARARARLRGRHAAARRSRCARPTGPVDVSRSPAPAAAAGTARPPASRPSSPTTSSCPSCARRSPRSSTIRTPPREPSWTASCSSTSPPARPRTTSSRRSAASTAGAKVGHAGTLDPFATGLLLVLLGRATRVQRFLMALPKSYETVARLGATSTTGDPEGEITETGRVPPDPPSLPTGERAPAPARLQRGAASAASAPTRGRGAGEEVEMPEREVTVDALRAALARGRPRGVRHRVLVGHLRALADRRPRRRLLRGAAAHGDRPVPRRRRRPGRGSCRWPRRCRSCPSCALEGEDARRASHGVAVPGGRAEGDGPARRRRRPDRRRRAARGRSAQAHRRLPRHEGHPPARRRARARGASRSARSTACTSATARSSAAPTPS